MTDSAEALIPIDLELRFVLFGLECLAGVVLSPPEAERAFRETSDCVSAKQYEFGRSHNVSITGSVDEYEPETIWLRVEGSRKIAAQLEWIVEAAGYHAGRLRRAEDRA